MYSLLLSLTWSISLVAAFAPQFPRSSPRSQLHEVIWADDVDLEAVDPGLGGVRLAQESAIKIVGDVRHKPGSAESKPRNLIRYTELTKVEESKVKDILSKSGGKIISIGQGVELYQDPGKMLDTIVKLGPMEAIKDAVNGAASAIDEKELVLNFLGGDDLIMAEVLDAASELVVMMDIATKAKVSFNSMCHSSIPSGTCTVCVVSRGESDEEFSGTAESIAAGEVYTRNGAWYTVERANINTAVE